MAGAGGGLAFRVVGASWSWLAGLVDVVVEVKAVVGMWR